MLRTEQFRRRLQRLAEQINEIGSRLTEAESIAKSVDKARHTPSHYHKHGGKLPLAVRTLFNELPLCTGRTIHEIQIEIGSIAEVESTPETISEVVNSLARKGELVIRCSRYYRTNAMLTASGCRRNKGEELLQEIRDNK